MAIVIARMMALSQRRTTFAVHVPADGGVLDAVGMAALAALIVAGFCAG